MADIEFTIFVEQWFFDIFLYDEGSESAITIFLFGFDPQFDILNAMADSDAIASIAIFSRFYNPYIFDISILFLLLFFLDDTIIFLKLFKFWII